MSEKIYELQSGRTVILHPCWEIIKDYDGNTISITMNLFCASQELAYDICKILTAIENADNTHRPDRPIIGNQDDLNTMKCFYQDTTQWMRDLVAEDPDNLLTPELVTFAQDLCEIVVNGDLNFPFNSGWEWCASYQCEKTEAETMTIAISLSDAIQRLKIL